MKIYTEIYILPRSLVHFDPSKKISKTGISKFLKSQTLTRLTEFIWPLPEALAGAKPSHRIIVLCVLPLISQVFHIKVIWGIFVLHFWKKYLRVPPSTSQTKPNQAKPSRAKATETSQAKATGAPLPRHTGTSARARPHPAASLPLLYANCLATRS